MDPQVPIYERSHDVPAAYRLMRAVIRVGFRVFYPRLRLLNRERLERPGPAILLVTHPQSLPVALLLISTLDHRVHCLLPSGEIRGLFRKLAARALGIHALDFSSRKQNSLFNPCLNILSDRGAIALFAGQNPQEGSHRAVVANFAARLSVEAILRGPDPVQTTIFPVHCLLGTGRRSIAPLMCVDMPIASHDFVPKVGEDLSAASHHLAEEVENSIGENIFGLAGADLKQFSWELQELSREHLRQKWSRRPDWKQRPEELHLSGFARKWIAEQNRTDPARLVELRESLAAYRETRRRCSMGELIVETSGAWQASGPRVAAAWLETVLGFPVALYGLINHLPALIALSLGGLLRNSPKRDPKVEWLLRIFIVLSSYTLQVFLVHFWWGRAVAGYYTLTLPVSGAYLWRYRWLVRRRIHVLFRKALHSASSARVARARENILGRFSRELDRSARSPTLPNAPSAGLSE